MGKLLIKNADITDIPLIRELTMQVWPQTYTPILGAIQVDYMLARFYSPDALKNQMEDMNHSFCICSYDGQPAAFASWSPIEPHIFKLHKLYILPGVQGKGIGRALVNYIVGDVKGKEA